MEIVSITLYKGERFIFTGLAASDRVNKYSNVKPGFLSVTFSQFR